MIRLLFGEDAYSKKEKMKELIDGFLKEGRYFLSSQIDTDNLNKEEFEELARSADNDIFGKKRVIICEDIVSDKNINEFILENLRFCGPSKNVFIFLEKELSKKTVEIFKKHGAKTEDFPQLSSWEIKKWLKNEAGKRGIDLTNDIEKSLLEESKNDLWVLSSNLEKYLLNKKKCVSSSVKNEEINIFKITDAVAEKNKSKAWLVFQKMILVGLDAEEIFWKIVWQVKNLLLAQRMPGLSADKMAQKCKLHPFVARKAISASRNFQEKELSRYSKDLIDLYHKSRQGFADFETGIEKFLIKL